MDFCWTSAHFAASPFSSSKPPARAAFRRPRSRSSSVPPPPSATSEGGGARRRAALRRAPPGLPAAPDRVPPAEHGSVSALYLASIGLGSVGGEGSDLIVFDRCGRVASAPGKVLVAGGYLVLERPNAGLVLSTSARFYAIVRPLRDELSHDSWAWVSPEPQISRTNFTSSIAENCSLLCRAPVPY